LSARNECVAGKTWAIVSRESKDIIKRYTIVFGAVRTDGTRFAFVVVALVVLGSFASARGCVVVSGYNASGTIFRARRTIGFGGFALFA
jgi:hypothetical protein